MNRRRIAALLRELADELDDTEAAEAHEAGDAERPVVILPNPSVRTVLAAELALRRMGKDPAAL